MSPPDWGRDITICDCIKPNCIHENFKLTFLYTEFSIYKDMQSYGRRHSLVSKIKLGLGLSEQTKNTGLLEKNKTKKKWQKFST